MRMGSLPMNRKFAAVVVLSMVISVPSLFAYGIGLQFDGRAGGAGFEFGPSVTFKLDSYPIIFAANLSIHNGNFGLGLTGDYWLFNKKIVDDLPVMWFFGYGAYVGLGLGDELYLSAGGRLPVGINAFFKKGFIEPYIQIAPSIGLVVSPEIDFPDWFIPASIGVRLWFK